MFAESLSLVNYRNIENQTVCFSPGVNFLYGDNAQGKTNVLEALYFYARGKSFRLASDKEQMGFGKQFFETKLCFQNKERRQELYYRVSGNERIRKRNGMPVTRPAEMLGHFRCVLFFPENLQMVKGGPEERRDFLNVAIAQSIPSYLSEYAKYKKTLEQRNALLKTAQKTGVFDEKQFYAWSYSLAQSGARIHVLRQEYLRPLSHFASSFMEELSDGKEKLKIKYESSVGAEEGMTEEEVLEALLLHLTENQQRETAVGFTLFGVHRDDLSLQINGKEARMFSSQGQQRSIVLCMKMAEGEAGRSFGGEYPVYLFDDVLSELDEGRRSFILKGMNDRQVIMTGCERSLLSRTDANLIEVVGGQYVSSHR